MLRCSDCKKGGFSGDAAALQTTLKPLHNATTSEKDSRAQRCREKLSGGDSFEICAAGFPVTSTNVACSGLPFASAENRAECLETNSLSSWSRLQSIRLVSHERIPAKWTKISETYENAASKMTIDNEC